MAPQFILISPFSSENEQFLAGMYFICPAFHHFPATFSVTDRTTTQVRIRLNMTLSSAHFARPETVMMTSRVDSVEDGRIVAGGTALAHLAGDQDVRQSLVLTARRQQRTAYIRTLSQRTRHILLTCFTVTYQSFTTTITNSGQGNKAERARAVCFATSIFFQSWQFRQVNLELCRGKNG